MRSGEVGRGMPPVARFITASGMTNLGDGVAVLAWSWTASLLTRDPLLVEIFGEGIADRVLYYPTTTREQGPRMGRITDNLTSGKAFADMGLPPMDPAVDTVSTTDRFEIELPVARDVPDAHERDERQVPLHAGGIEPPCTG